MITLDDIIAVTLFEDSWVLDNKLIETLNSDTNTLPIWKMKLMESKTNH